MICVNILKMRQSASKTTYANDPSENYKEGLCFECATGIKLSDVNISTKTKLRKKK